MTNTYDKSGVLGGNYDSAAMDFEAAHQALLKEARNAGYREGFEAGREYAQNMPFADGKNPFKLGSRSEVEREAFDVAEGVAESFTVGDQQAKEYVESAIKETRAYNQQALRDEIIEQAKDDIDKLKIDNKFFGPSYLVNFLRCYAEFVVNKEKRTVVALMRGCITDKVHARGIAKCAPGDCFNIHIGKAIALRRALGLPVPDEYLNAPQPSEVRVGDVIEVTLDNGDVEIKPVIETRCHGRINVSLPGRGIEYPAPYARIVDDSRETEVGEDYY